MCVGGGFWLQLIISFLCGTFSKLVSPRIFPWGMEMGIPAKYIVCLF